MAPRTQKKGDTGNKKTLPVFLLAGTMFLLAVVLEVVYIVTENFPSEEEINKSLIPKKPKPPSKNVFDNLYKKYPSYKTDKKETKEFKLPEKDLKTENVAAFEHNNTIGPKDAMITLTAFTDSNCLSCRSEVKRLLGIVKSNPGRVRLVLKFVPAVVGETNGGIFDQIARREGVFPAYFKALMAKNKELGVDELLELLDRLDVPLADLRRVMQEDMNGILRDMQRDINQADRLGIRDGKLPVVYLNEYRVGQNYLPQENLDEIVRMMIKGDYLLGE